MKKTTPQIVFLFFIISFLCAGQVLGQSISLYEEFHGHIRFDWFGQSNNVADNSDSGFSCSGDNKSSSTATVTIPSGAIVKKAILYWSGSGSGDFDVTLSGPNFSGMNISATREMHATFSLKNFFAGAYDVTSVISSSGSGSYTLSGLDANDGFAHCVFNTVYSGWSIFVVYEMPSLPFSTIRIYDGFEGMRDESKDFLIDQIMIESPSDTKFGVLAWESDVFFSPGESVSINGSKISNAANPANKIFNQTNSSTGTTSYNMDLDIFDISGYVSVGDTEMPIKISVGGDLIFLNAFAVSYQNQLPDATVLLNTGTAPCDGSDGTLTFEVLNHNCNDILPQGTPIYFYANNSSGTPLTSAVTLADIPIGGSESQTILLPNPGANIDLIAVVDPLLAVLELDEANNADTLALTIGQATVHESLADTVCYGDSIIWQGQYYGTNVVIADTLTTSGGCDSIVDWTLTVRPQMETMIQDTICASNIPYLLPDGSVATETGLFTSILASQTGCDSTVIVDLLVETALVTNMNVTTCPDDLPYVLPDGTTTNSGGQFTSILTGQSGCDSTVIVNLVIDNIIWPVSMEICPGDTAVFDGEFFFRDTSFTTTHVSTTGGCDSLIQFDLIVKPWQIDSNFVVLCPGDEYVLPDGKTVTDTGVYRTRLDCNHLIYSVLSRDSLSDSIGLPDTMSVVLGETIMLTPSTGLNGTDYQWRPPTYLDCTDCLSLKSTPLTSILYHFSAKNSHGCRIRDSVFVNVVLPAYEVFIPNAFSPNNDGRNDEFKVYGNKIKNIKRFEIYDRWGALIFSKNNMNQANGWDGRYKGKLLNTDVFIYLIEIEFLDGGVELYSGDLMIWR